MFQVAGVGVSMDIVSKQGLSALVMLLAIVMTALAIISSVVRGRDGSGGSDGEF